jgi:hypothetical protein
MPGYAMDARSNRHFVIAVESGHYEIHEGNAFNYSDGIQLGASGTQYYLLTTGAKYPHLLLHIFFGGEATVQLFEGADRSGSAAGTVFNRSRPSSKAPTMTVHKGITGGTTDGVQIQTSRYGSGLIGGGEMRGENEWILKPNTKYLLLITSIVATNDIAVGINWYEPESLNG